MEKKLLLHGKKYLHFPICNADENLPYKDDKGYRYIDVIVEGKRKNSFWSALYR